MASEQEIIRAIQSAASMESRIRIVDQLGHKLKPQHRELIRFLLELSRNESQQQLSYAAKRALFQIRSRYNITNFPLFLMDPVSLIQSTDPGYRVKALELLEKGQVSHEQCYFFLGSLFFEDDPFVLSRMVRVIPILKTHLSVEKLAKIIKDLTSHEDSRVRANALETLKLLQSEKEADHFSLLFKSLNDPDQRVRNHAIQELKSSTNDKLNENLLSVLERPEHYYELKSCYHLAELRNLELSEKLQDKVEKKLQELEVETVEEEIGSSSESPIAIEMESKKPTFFDLGGLAYASRNLWVLSSCILILCFAFWQKWQLSRQESTVIELRTQLKNLQQDSQTKEKKLAAVMDKTIPLAKQDLNLKEKLEIFRKEGETLRHNAEIFLDEGENAFEQERYGESIEYYKALYSVYKDNRLAVDAVRWLSKTQKVQNVLNSMNDYVEKKQFISAYKKLEEVKHLLSVDVYKAHYERITRIRKKHQEEK
jgi:hypothetical protein